MFNITEEEIRDKMFFIRQDDNPQPIAVIKVSDLMATNEKIPQGNLISREVLEEDAKQASIPYTYTAPQHDWKCGYPDITKGDGAE